MTRAHLWVGDLLERNAQQAYNRLTDHQLPGWATSKPNARALRQGGR